MFILCFVEVVRFMLKIGINLFVFFVYILLVVGKIVEIIWEDLNNYFDFFCVIIDRVMCGIL